MTFLKEMQVHPGRPVELRVLPGNDQVVLANHGRAQWILTFSFAAMALIGALGLTWMVAAWNRYLARNGDPAHRLTPGRGAFEAS